MPKGIPNRRFRGKKVKTNREYTSTPHKTRNSKPIKVSLENYHKDSIKYMQDKLGRTPTMEEAVDLDREWAESKINASTPTELLMGSKSLNNRVSNKKTLVGRQFNDIVESGLADMKVEDPEGSGIRAQGKNIPSPMFRNL